MKTLISFIMGIFIVIPGSLHAGEGEDHANRSMEWRAGVARVVITPEEPMWMAGFASRTRPSEGTLHDIYAKALAIESGDGMRGVLITSDLTGIPKGISARVRDRIESQYDLSRDQIILNTSHTHSAPVLRGLTPDVYPLDSAQIRLVNSYSNILEEQLVRLAGDALQSMEPARIYAGNGVARFAVNRRNNPSATLQRLTEMAGPSDYAVPVLKIANDVGDLKAVVFGYACHTTSLSGYEWSGDYAGFAQLELEKKHPGTTALFFQGAGADQNPLPRRTVPLSEQYGRELALVVDRVLKEEMRPLPSLLSTAYSEVDLKFAAPPTREELSAFADESSGYQNRWANRLIEKLDRGENFPTSYPYPVQVWNIGDQPVIALGGELVVDYSIALKRIFGSDTIIMGYSNDVMAYIPSGRVLKEGGYEGASSQRAFGHASTWAPDIETVIIHETLQLAKQVGLPMSESSLTEN